MASNSLVAWQNHYLFFFSLAAFSLLLLLGAYINNHETNTDFNFHYYKALGIYNPGLFQDKASFDSYPPISALIGAVPALLGKNAFAVFYLLAIFFGLPLLLFFVSKNLFVFPTMLCVCSIYSFFNDFTFAQFWASAAAVLLVWVFLQKRIKFWNIVLLFLFMVFVHNEGLNLFVVIILAFFTWNILLLLKKNNFFLALLPIELNRLYFVEFPYNQLQNIVFLVNRFGMWLWPLLFLTKVEFKHFLFMGLTILAFLVSARITFTASIFLAWIVADGLKKFYKENGAEINNSLFTGKVFNKKIALHVIIFSLLLLQYIVSVFWS